MKKTHCQILAIIILCCTGVLIYSNTFHTTFHFDDQNNIVTNLNIRDLSDIKSIWNYWPTRFIAYLSFSINYYFYQLNVFGYHLVNIVVHIISAILVFYFILLILSTPRMKGENITKHANLISFFAALIFLAHPIQTQAVTYIVQRATSLATLFYLAALIFYIKSRLLGERFISSNIYYLASIIMAIMAMFTKEIAITLPFMVLLCEAYFFKTKDRIRLVKFTPFFITLLIIPLTALMSRFVNIVGMRIGTEAITHISPLSYLFTQFRVIVIYIRLLFLPINQNLDYAYPVSATLVDLPTLASFLFLIIILVVAVRIASKHKLISFGIFWFFLTLLPESSIFPIKDVMFEHRLYLPMVGFSIFLTGFIYYRFAAKNVKPITMIAILVMLVACYSMLTYSRNYIWGNDLRLWNDTALKSPKNFRAYVQRGNAYIDRNYVDKAIADYTKAIELYPELALSYYSRGNAYSIKGYFNQAIADYTKAIELYPDLSTGYYNRGNAYSSKGYFDQAIADYTKAIELDPKNAKAYYNRAVAYFYKKEYDKSWDDAHKTQMLGYAFKPGFLEELKKASGVH